MIVFRGCLIFATYRPKANVLLFWIQDHVKAPIGTMLSDVIDRTIPGIVVINYELQH